MQQMIKRIAAWFKKWVRTKKRATNQLASMPTFIDTFGTLDPLVWTVSNWTAPGNSSTHQGRFDSSNVFIRNGMLHLALTQYESHDGTIQSYGGEVALKRQLGYGKYEWVMQASHAPDGNRVSGSVSGCFNYKTSSEVEIDFEVEGSSAEDVVHCTSWVHEIKPNQHTQTKITPAPHLDFHTYAFIWTPTEIQYLIDNRIVAMHAKVVPQSQATVMINHWGTDSVNWGGRATPNVTRHMIIKEFRYTPFNELRQ